MAGLLYGQAYNNRRPMQGKSLTGPHLPTTLRRARAFFIALACFAYPAAMLSPSVSVRQLSPVDVDAFRFIRLEALCQCPGALVGVAGFYAVDSPKTRLVMLFLRVEERSDGPTTASPSMR
jgi:hypothetical protein